MFKSRGILLCTACSVGLLLCPRVAQAACTAPQPLAQCTPDERAERLELALTNEARRARTWRYVWTGINGALAVGSFAILPLVDEEDHPDFIVGGIGSALTMALTFFVPLEVESNAERARESRSLPPAQRLPRLEKLTLESEADAKLRVTWPFHVVNLIGCTIAGSIIAFGYDHYASGILTGVSGLVLGEAQLFTQPVGPREASELPQQLRLRPFLRTTETAHFFGVAGVF